MKPLSVEIVNEGTHDPAGTPVMRVYLDGVDWSGRVQAGSLSAQIGDRGGVSLVTLTLITRDLSIRTERPS